MAEAEEALGKSISAVETSERLETLKMKITKDKLINLEELYEGEEKISLLKLRIAETKNRRIYKIEEGKER